MRSIDTGTGRYDSVRANIVDPPGLHALMSSNERVPAAGPAPVRYRRILDTYLRGLSVILMLLGLRQWAVIMGLVGSAGGPFETMTTAWKLATMELAVVDLVAAVGLWMRVSWGTVLWIFAALSEIALHTVFIRSFGGDVMVIAFHLVTVGAYVALSILARRAHEY
ncbi:MAG: DUF6163 family protein [Bauldia sp.]